jgi:hypothetical protein
LLYFDPVFLDFASHDGVGGSELAFADLLLGLSKFGFVVVFDLG